MSTPRRPEPVILLGIHRSGTTLAARMIEKLGVFMGAELDPNHEAWLFLELNSAALAQCGARWDQPEPVRALLTDPELSRLVERFFEYMLRSPAARRFTGRPWYRRETGVASVRGPWGWKDPRTLLLLPIWLRIFPAARLIHVTRHGVDVAASLRERQAATHRRITEMLERGELFDWRDPERKLMESARVTTLDGAFGLWAEYMGAARSALHDRPHLELAFESIVTDPAGAAGSIAAHLGIDPSSEQLEDATSLPRSSRALAYRDDPELVAFAETARSDLARFGYGGSGGERER